ncbi:acyl carrier protein [Roseibium salinum]|nr:acyl carrier protein [Roseibium salinum]
MARETLIDAAAITLSAPLEDYGIDSILITRLTDELERDFGPLSKTLFFEHQTLGALVDHFLNAHAARLAGLLGAAENEPRGAVPSRAAVVQKAQKPGTEEPVAIIGLGGPLSGGADAPRVLAEPRRRP